MAATGEFVESSAALGDAAALRARINQDSYLFFRGLLDPAAVRGVRTEILTVLADLGWLAPGSNPDEARPGEFITREGEPEWWAANEGVQSLQAYHELAHADSVVDLVRSLLDAEVLVHPRKIARITFPGSEFPTPPHQDFPLVQGAADTFTVWVPFGAVTPDMGGLRLLPGSHRTGLLQVVQANGVGGLGVAVDEDTGWLSASYAPGDALVMHSFTVHHAPPNRSDRLRLSTDYRYQALADPVGEASLLPHGYPQNTPGWKELTTGWSSIAAIERPAGVRIGEFLDPTADFGELPSRYAVPGVTAPAIRVTVWNENVHEQQHAHVRQIYPNGIHGAVASAIGDWLGAEAAVRMATLDEPEHGLTAAVLAETDVLTWWGHAAHDQVADEVVARVYQRVLDGMGLVVLHSGHWSKIFTRLMGTSCTLHWREEDDREVVWTVNPSHPIAQGVSPAFVIPAQEMYGEYFDIPAPDELVFISSFTGGEVFRSGSCFRRGRGRIFYFSPGHETYPVYHQDEVRRVIANGVRWAYQSELATVDNSTCVHAPKEWFADPTVRVGRVRPNELVGS